MKKQFERLCGKIMPDGDGKDFPVIIFFVLLLLFLHKRNLFHRDVGLIHKTGPYKHTFIHQTKANPQMAKDYYYDFSSSSSYCFWGAIFP